MDANFLNGEWSGDTPEWRVAQFSKDVARLATSLERGDVFYIQQALASARASWKYGGVEHLHAEALPVLLAARKIVEGR